MRLIRTTLLWFCLICCLHSIQQTDASITSGFFDWMGGEDGVHNHGKKVDTLTIVEISDMRVRDIKRRLTREHGYGSDEVAKMIDKKELVNALSFEEHKVEQQEMDRKKRVVFRRSIIMALICVIVVMFRPLFVHAWEVLCVNVEVYTDRKKYEFSRISEYRSPKALFGLFLMIIVDSLRFWLSVSVLLSWVMKSKYFFPIPQISIRPAALVATATGNTGGAGPLGNYGLNVGPMVVSWLFRFVNGRLEGWMGKVLATANKRQRKAKRKQEKAEEKEREKQEAAIAKEERRAARRARRKERKEREERQKAAEEAAANQPENVEGHQTTNGSMDGNGEEICEKKESDRENTTKNNPLEEWFGGMDELD